MSQAPQPMEIQEKVGEMSSRLGTWEKQTCDVTWGFPALLYSPSGAKMTITRDSTRVDGIEEYTVVKTVPRNCVCCCFPLLHLVLDLPCIGLSKMCPNAAEPLWGRHGAIRIAEKYTAEEALRPRHAVGNLKFVQNCDAGTNIVFRVTPMDRYTDITFIVDEKGQTLGGPLTTVCGPGISNCGFPCPPPQRPRALSFPHLTWASWPPHLHLCDFQVVAPDFQSMTDSNQVEGCQGPCTYVCCPYTQTLVWAKTSGNVEATPLLKGR